MPSLRTRRALAPSFVVTMSVLPACAREPVTPEPVETAPTASVAPIASTAPTAAVANAELDASAAPPPAEPSAAADAGSSSTQKSAFASWNVSRAGKDCTAKKICRQGESCTDAAKPYPCPSEAPSFPMIVTRKVDGECAFHVHAKMPRCPPRMACNPPPPRTVKVDCPAD